MQNPHDYTEDSNSSNNVEFANIMQVRIDRRGVLKGGAGLTALAMFGGFPLAGCHSVSPSATAMLNRLQSLKFTPVPHYTGDEMLVADGYQARAFLHLGEPIKNGVEPFNDDRDHDGESFAYRMGDNHDGMWFFGLKNDKYDAKESNHALLAMNHEYTNANLHPHGEAGFRTQDDSDADKIFAKRRLGEDVRREVYAHGVSVVELVRAKDGSYDLVKNSRFNRRYHSASEVRFSGAAKGSSLLATKYDPQGMRTRGINNQCGAGCSPWGTYLTTEENFLNVFARGDDKAVIGEQADIAKTRYGLKANSTGGGYLWHTPNEHEKSADEWARWNATAKGGSAQEDYRHAFHGFGYITEIDPFDVGGTPIKRTSLGRFAHENCAFAKAVEGKPIVIYMGDDARGEYIYKFVSSTLWDSKDVGRGVSAGDKYLDSGNLYVARFNEDGSGEWLLLQHGKIRHKNYEFADQADVVIHARLAADAVGATKMDRPEWVSVSPITGEVYVTLTNNSKRTEESTNAANPRSYDDKGNVHGHIIRWRERENNAFDWDIYLFGAPNVHAQNLSNLSAQNDFSSPDGLYFDPRGVLWIQTDDSVYTATTNCMLLAALPSHVGDGAPITTSAGEITLLGAPATEHTLKRFFVGPRGCEITGITMAPDLRTLFINIQHPGEDNPDVHWGAVAGGHVPRSATVMINKKDGGVILGESLA